MGLRKLRDAEAVHRAASPRGAWLDLRTGDVNRDDPRAGAVVGPGPITGLLLGDFGPVPGCADPDRLLL